MFFMGANRQQKRAAGRWGGASSWKAKGRRLRLSAGSKSEGADGLAVGDDAVAVVAPGPAGSPESHGSRGVDLKARIGTASLAFRGYDVANLGRTPELLAHPAYGPVMRRHLDLASAVAADTLKRPFDLAARVETRAESNLGTFAEDLALIVSVELAQLALLDEFFGVSVKGAKQTFGYSLGEMASIVAGGVFSMEELLPVPLCCADDCADLAEETTLGVVFSRGPAIPLQDVQDLCVEISGDGHGMIGVSSYLSPNTLLVIGQGDTLDRLERAIPGRLPEKTMLRRKPHKLPPLHTPLVWQRNVPNRAATLLYKISGLRQAPNPRVVSCVTGRADYDGRNVRDTLIRWVDHPQLLWDAITETLVAGVDLVIHAGPAPNLIPATFERLSNNISKQLGNRYMQMIGRGVGSGMNRYAWLARLLPTKAALLKAPHVQHVVLEDWLLAQRLPE
jgi:[acyl-carrier-protein] S-malonyltransferase